MFSADQAPMEFKSDVFRDICLKVSSDDWDTVLLKGTDDKDLTIRCVAVLKPEVFSDFKEVTFCSAFFEQTKQFNIWMKHGVQWIKSDIKPFKTSHKKDAQYLHFIYLSSSADEYWNTSVVQTEKQRMLKECVNELKILGRKDLYSKLCVSLSNHNYTKSLLNTEDLAKTLMEGDTRGLNKYQDYDGIALLATCMPDKWIQDYLKQYGFSYDDIRVMYFNTRLYQDACRIVRGDVKSDKLFIVGDYRSMIALQDMFGVGQDNVKEQYSDLVKFRDRTKVRGKDKNKNKRKRKCNPNSILSKYPDHKSKINNLQQYCKRENLDYNKIDIDDFVKKKLSPKKYITSINLE